MVFIWRALASEPTNITAESKYAWTENTGWLNFGSSDGGVMVTDSRLTGYIWSENLGWISLNCSNNDTCGTVNYGVVNDGEGNLSGYAWSENTGWLDFAPANGGVRIDSGGVFSGYAWNENAGWVVFNCQDLDVCGISDFKVKTTWLPLSARNQDAGDDEDGDTAVEVSAVRFSSTDSTILISWKTNHSADSHVRWGLDKNLEEEKNDNDKERDHRVILRGLRPDTRYYFRVKSKDGDGDSDSSKIYEALTKQSSAVFQKRQWQSVGQDGNSSEKLEDVKIEVKDKSEAEMGKTETTAPVMKDGAGDVSKPSWFSGLWQGMRSGFSSLFSGARELALGAQRGIAGFFGHSGRLIAGAYDNLISKFSKEKAIEIAGLDRAKFFTTSVFSRDEKKLLAEVRFQILDKSDNPIPHLETMLFSDPQESTTDENGVASFKDVPVGSHTLAFDYQDEKFEKKVTIADTLTDEGKVRAEIVQVKAEREKIAFWMWVVIVLLGVMAGVASYFAMKYRKLLKISGTGAE